MEKSQLFKRVLLLVGLYFCMCIEQDDNKLAYLEMIHNLVEILDK